MRLQKSMKGKSKAQGSKLTSEEKVLAEKLQRIQRADYEKKLAMKIRRRLHVRSLEPPAGPAPG